MMPAMRTSWRTVGVVVFGVAAVLLASMGGAIVAAPLTIPAMLVAMRRHPTRAFRTVGTLLVSLTAAEVAWALAYLTAGETNPLIWALPATALVAAALASLHSSRLTTQRG